MKQINCMVVDDEPIARDIIISHIEATPGLTVVKSCINAYEAYEGLYEAKIDLLFLDIQMPVITGIDFLKSLKNPPLVIFTTAFQNYAIDGFDLNSVDYLLKPITYERFYQAIQKAHERLNARQGQPQQIAPADHIFIKQDAKFIRVNFNQINYIQAERDFSSVFLDEQRVLANMHLKIFDDVLPKTMFLRVHRSFIINLTKIKAIKGNILQLDTIEVPIGANYRDELLSRLGI
ncbi:MAG: response regulator transcription factor [Sphingobacteriaceae bacterium]|nr:MAG: response regulator transcription factor [Sphingobacteriaceae bacterium]